MIVVGLTGGIGSGKSLVAKMFSSLGIAIYDSDTQAKHIIATNPQVKQAIKVLLGEEAYVDGVYNRTYVASIVFADTEKLAQLNNIVHPALALHFMQWKEKQQSPYVIKEAAILFESGAYKHCDYIITVTAPEKLRIARVMKRDNINEAQVVERMKQQWTDAERIALSDAVIENIDIDKTLKEVQKLHTQLLKNIEKGR
jgi:dephospho-coA kinase